MFRLVLPCFLGLLCSACAELKNQARLGLAGSGSAYAPNQLPRAAGGSAAQDAVQGVGNAVGAAAVSRALGGCVASCPQDSTCNTQTGLCDRVPCFGRCAPGELCDKERDRCIPMAPLNIGQSPR
jgi:hypothetical protein